MLEKIIDSKDNIISSCKNSIVGYNTISSYLERKIGLGKKHRIGLFRKIMYSFVMTSSLCSSLFLANDWYAKNRTSDKSVPAYTYVRIESKKCKSRSFCFVKQSSSGSIVIDSEGNKAEEITHIKPTNTFRIAFIGGSTTQCWGRESYSNELYKLLEGNKRLFNKKTEFEIINAGRSGAAGQNIVKEFKQACLPLNLDIVIYGPEWNDVGGCSIITDEQNLTLKRYFVGLADDKDVAALGPWFENHIDTFRKQKRRKIERMYTALDDTSERIMQRLPALRELTNTTLTKLKNVLEPSEYERLRLRDHGKNPIGYASHMDDFEPWLYRQNIEELIASAKENGIKHIGISTTPDDFEDYYAPGIPSNCYVIYELNDWVSYNRRVLNPEARRLAKENGIILVDLETELNKIQNKKPHFDEFMHYTLEGFKPVGEIFFKTLLPYIKNLP